MLIRHGCLGYGMRLEPVSATRSKTMYNCNRSVQRCWQSNSQIKSVVPNCDWFVAWIIPDPIVNT
eukprot:171030-Amphidinium_carterae.1